MIFEYKCFINVVCNALKPLSTKNVIILFLIHCYSHKKKLMCKVLRSESWMRTTCCFSQLFQMCCFHLLLASTRCFVVQNICFDSMPVKIKVTNLIHRFSDSICIYPNVEVRWPCTTPILYFFYWFIKGFCHFQILVCMLKRYVSNCMEIRFNEPKSRGEVIGLLMSNINWQHFQWPKHRPHPNSQLGLQPYEIIFTLSHKYSRTQHLRYVNVHVGFPWDGGQLDS